MMDIGDFNMMLQAILVNIPTFWGTPKTFIELKEEQKEKLISAFKALKNAIHKTREHINKEGYKANTDLSELWTEASASMISAKLFGESSFIYDIARKGDFWSDPSIWSNEESSMEMIPKLKDIDTKCEEILNKLR